MIDEIKWYTKPTSNGEYVLGPQPTEYKLELEDLDNGTVRSIVTGNLIDNVVSYNWTKCNFEFENLNYEEAHDLLTRVSKNPIYAKVENPLYNNNVLEAEFRCSKKSITRMKTRTNEPRYSVSLNLVQKKKVAGQ